MSTNEELLDINALLRQTHKNRARQLRAHAVWRAEKVERERGNWALAYLLKVAGNRLEHTNNLVERMLAESAPLFRDRGFSDRTINALVARGVDAPEQLLFASKLGLREAPGVGPAALAEIMRYRARFLEDPATTEADAQWKARRKRAATLSLCVDCKRNTCPRDQPGESYMVHDQLWASIGMAADGGFLCIECLERRLGRQLKHTDFTDAPANIPGWRKSPRLNDRLQQAGSKHEMMAASINKLILDHGTDAGQRLWKLLEIKGKLLDIGLNPVGRLKESVPAVAAELELLKSNPAVLASPGTAMVVLADRKKIFTIPLSRLPGGSFCDSIEEAVSYTRTSAGAAADKCADGAAIAFAIEALIDEHGRAPGRGDEQTDQALDHARFAVGFLFLAMSERMRAERADEIDSLSVRGIFPAVIGLRYDSGAIWPVALGLAPVKE